VTGGSEVVPDAEDESRVGVVDRRGEVAGEKERLHVGRFFRGCRPDFFKKPLFAFVRRKPVARSSICSTTAGCSLADHQCTDFVVQAAWRAVDKAEWLNESPGVQAQRVRFGATLPPVLTAEPTALEKHRKA